jgi:hypothetical protein
MSEADMTTATGAPARPGLADELAASRDALSTAAAAVDRARELAGKDSDGVVKNEELFVFFEEVDDAYRQAVVLEMVWRNKPGAVSQAAGEEQVPRPTETAPKTQ